MQRRGGKRNCLLVMRKQKDADFDKVTSNDEDDRKIKELLGLDADAEFDIEDRIRQKMIDAIRESIGDIDTAAKWLEISEKKKRSERTVQRTERKIRRLATNSHRQTSRIVQTGC